MQRKIYAHTFIIEKVNHPLHTSSEVSRWMKVPDFKTSGTKICFYVGQSPSLDAKSFPVIPQIYFILWNSKVYQSIHKSPKPVPILRDIDLVHASPSHLHNIQFNSLPSTATLPRIVFPSVSSP